MESIEGKLEMKNLCFTKILFEQTQNGQNEKKIKFNISVEYEQKTEKNILVRLIANITEESNSININVVEQADFELVNAEMLDNEAKNNILKVNTIAILMPYMRSQIAILTAQPGMNSLQIPIIDASILAKNAVSK